MTFANWLDHFQRNSALHRELESEIDWNAPVLLSEREVKAFARSFQRFELGESGDGQRLRAKAAQEGDPIYLAALELLVQEEQKHSALFRRGLERINAPTLDAHWSDAAFTVLRRMLGLRTELGLFLIAETVAMGYFTALAEHAPDPVLRGIGRRIATDEQNHIRFQIDRLRQGFHRTPGAVRAVIGLIWGVIAAGAATVMVLDHGQALRACGLSPAKFWFQATGRFQGAAKLIFATPKAESLGPLTANA